MCLLEAAAVLTSVLVLVTAVTLMAAGVAGPPMAFAMAAIGFASVVMVVAQVSFGAACLLRWLKARREGQGAAAVTGRPS